MKQKTNNSRFCKKYLSLFLSLLLLASALCACSEQPFGNEDVTTKASDGVAATTAADDSTAPEYNYPAVFYNNAEFRILNEKDRYSMIYQLISDDFSTGDTLDSARHAVNVKVSERYGIKMTETQVDYKSILKEAQANVIAGGNDAYDVFYLTGTHIGTLMGQGFLQNLRDVDGLNMEADYWNQRMIDDGTLKGKYLYYLCGNYHLQPFESTTCFFFNKTMCDTNSLEYPYGLVRERKWTIDKVMEMGAVVASLNGQESFAYSESGSCVYGVVSISNAITAMVIGCDAYMVEKDATGYPVVGFGGERFQSICTKIAELTASEGIFHTPTVMPTFYQGRALFAAAELKVAANQISDMENDFGILPVPMFNEEQTQYVSNLFYGACLMCIPTTCPDVERAAILMDTLNYEAEKNVIPVYQVRVCYKGLRDNDSISMLDIINKTRYLDWGLCYDWVGAFKTPMLNQLKVGNGNMASLVKSNKSVVEAKIKTTMDSLPD